jgi:hypothetical protein
VVVRQPRHGHQATHRRHVQDAALAPRTHERENSLHHGDGAEDVHFELLAQLIHRAFLQRTFMTVACIIDERVNRTDILLDFFYCNSELFRCVRHVENAREGRPGTKLLELSHRVLFSYSANYFETCVKQGSGKCLAKSAANASDDDYLFH